ncbi:hypothetical protein PR202_gb04442 [Eleusine coracana subsp. coracana]|uniref:Vacuolar protein-sorting-associated protein 36 n=1 Tax=Eleusine coracana subsp. coracana TaxID=191504 RepID=A0AAV5E4J2_ELECO|nr:hypothetical protein PR202_gb04442 [Eleusine coracana subsp. coracana]
MSAAAADWLPSAAVTASGRPVLSSGEVERNLLPLVDLEPEENPRLGALRGCLLALTSHRLIFLHEPSRSARALPLASVVHAYPPHRRHGHNPLRSIFSSSSSSHHHRIRLQISLPPLRSEVVAIVITCKADVDVFFGRLLEAIRARGWEMAPAAAPASGAPAAEEAAPAPEDIAIRMPVVGVSGILRMEQEAWESAGQNLQDAFQDLNALMVRIVHICCNRVRLITILLFELNSLFSLQSKAKEMMQLAEKMRLKLLTNSIQNSGDEEMGSKQDMQDLLLSVGIVSPVTKETAGALYHQQLSLQVFARISSLAQKPDNLQKGISPSDAAFTLGIAPALAKEHLQNAENKGLLCRDDSPDGLRFFINLFNDIDPQNIYLQKSHGLYHGWISVAMASQ